MKKRQAFTLIELLVVIAIIAILAAILFPVFAQAREKARGIACLSNEKQMGTALMMYAQDNDGGFPTWNETVYMQYACGKAYAGNVPCSQTPVETPSVEWDAKLVPYVKNGDPGAGYTPKPDAGGVWHCPDNELDSSFRSYGMNYGFTYALESASPWYFLYRTEAEIDKPALCVFVGESGGDIKAMPNGPTKTANNAGNAGLINPPYNFSGYDQHNNLSYGRISWDRERPYRHNNGANYVFADGHAKWMNADTIYPHPPAPSTAYTSYNGIAYCAAANYFAAKASERQDRYTKAVNTYGYTSCTLQ